MRRHALLLVALVLLVLLAGWVALREQPPSQPRRQPLAETAPDADAEHPTERLPVPRAPDRAHSPPAAPPPRETASPGDRTESTHRVRVTVIDSAGRPAAGALVAFLDGRFASRERELGESPVVATADADADGVAERRLPRGESVRVRASLAGEVAASRSLSVRADEEVTLRLGPAHAVSGRLLRRDGVGIAGAHLTAHFENRTGFLSATTRSGDDGSFAFDRIPQAHLERERFYLEARDAAFHPGRIEARTAAGRAGTIEMRLLAVAWISGRCVDESGAPVRGALASFHAREPFHEASVFTNEEGRFRLMSTPSVGRLFVTSQHAAPWSRDDVTVTGSCDVAEIVLERGRTLTGVLVDAAGAPLVGVIGVSGRDLRGRHAKTDANGRFAVEHLPPYGLELEARARLPDDPEEDHVYVLRRVGVVAGAGDLRIVLRGGNHLLVHVTDAATGRPYVGEASVACTARNAERFRVHESITVKSGKILVDVRKPGTYEVRVSGRGLDDVCLPSVVIRADRRTEIDVALTPEGD